VVKASGVPDLDFSGGLSGTLLWPDLPGTGLAVKFNLSAYIAHRTMGVLLLRHHNAVAQRTEILFVVTP
jgi:hypothetical protein